MLLRRISSSRLSYNKLVGLYATATGELKVLSKSFVPVLDKRKRSPTLFSENSSPAPGSQTSSDESLLDASRIQKVVSPNNPCHSDWLGISQSIFVFQEPHFERYPVQHPHHNLRQLRQSHPIPEGLWHSQTAPTLQERDKQLQRLAQLRRTRELEQQSHMRSKSTAPILRIARACPSICYSLRNTLKKAMQNRR